jgi:hypothetical protein
MDTAPGFDALGQDLLVLDAKLGVGDTSFGFGERAMM